MKKIVIGFVILVALILGFNVTSFGQDKADEIGVSVVGLRQDAKITLQDNLKLNRDTDSVGFAVDYTHFPKNKWVGIQGEFSMTFHNKDYHEIITRGDTTIERKGTSKVALGTGLYGVVLKPRNKKVAPFVRGLVGISNTDLSQKVTFVNGKGSVAVKDTFSFAYGGGAGFEVRLKKDSRLRVRTDLTYLQTKRDNVAQHNFRVGVGIVL